MFHRVKPEPSPSVAAQAPQQAAPAPVVAAQPQMVSLKEEIRPAAARPPVQQETPVQNNKSPQQPAKPIENTARKEEEKTMIDQSKKSDAPVENAPRALEIPGATAPYQRPGQPPLRAAGNFPGSYPGYNPAARDITASDRSLIIGRGITMSGEIEACDHLVVEGTVEATLKGASVLDIAESGVFYGAVEIDEATVAGRFEGDLHVSGRLTIRSGGAIKGSITYKELEVEAGATIDGRLSPVGAEHEAKKGHAKPKAKRDNSDAANSDGELFSKQAAAE